MPGASASGILRSAGLRAGTENAGDSRRCGL